MATFVESSNDAVKKIRIDSGFLAFRLHFKAGLLRNRLYYCRFVIAIGPEVLYRFEVRVCEEFFAKRGFSGLGPFIVIRDF